MTVFGTPDVTADKLLNLVTLVLRFADGQLHLQSVVEAPMSQAAGSGDAAPRAGLVAPQIGAILGGTGTYNLARGSYEVSQGKDGLTLNVYVLCN